MPRYYFHVHDGVWLVNDDVGAILPDIEAARAEAQKQAHEIVGLLHDQPLLVRDLKVDIADMSGRTLGSIPLATFAETISNV